MGCAFSQFKRMWMESGLKNMFFNPCYRLTAASKLYALQKWQVGILFYVGHSYCVFLFIEIFTLYFYCCHIIYKSSKLLILAELQGRYCCAYPLFPLVGAEHPFAEADLASTMRAFSLQFFTKWLCLSLLGSYILITLVPSHWGPSN